MSIVDLKTDQALRVGRMPALETAELNATTQTIDDSLAPLRGSTQPELYAAALAVLTKTALREAPGYGPRRGAIVLRLIAKRLEQEAML